MQPCVYILASKPYVTLYVGATSDLIKRVWQHREGLLDGFTRRYGVHRLVWCELHDTMDAAISREKAMKEWRRQWKISRILAMNPCWDDLYETLL